MDADLVAVASTGANALITLMATDAWSQAKRAFASLFAESRPEVGRVVEGELEESRRELMAAREQGDDQAREELLAQWQGRLRRMLLADPSLVVRLRNIVDEFGGPSPQLSIDAKNVSVRGTATGHGRIYQQGQGVQHNR